MIQTIELLRVVHNDEMSVRTRNSLLSVGIESLTALATWSASDLSRQRNVGRVALKEIRAALREKGLSLKGDEAKHAPTPEQRICVALERIADALEALARTRRAPNQDNAAASIDPSTTTPV